MPVDYQGFANQNSLGQLAGSISQFSENQGRLADLARQRQMQDVTMSEDGIKKSTLELANMIRSGAPRDQVETWANQRYAELGLPTDQIKQKLDGVYAVPNEVTGQADLMEESAFPEISAKQRMEQRYAAKKPEATTTLSKLIAERERIAAQNPESPQLRIYDQMIDKETTHTPFMQVATGATGTKLITASKDGATPIVQDLGILPKQTNDKLVAVFSPDGVTPVLVPASQAAGMTPYNKPTSAKLSAQEQKEVFEADENAQAATVVIGTLKQALSINDKAYSGYGALLRAKVESNLPGKVSDKANNTIQMDNLILEQALSSLKFVFGAMPTDGERVMLLKLQASQEKTPTQRKTIIEKAIEMADSKLRFNQQKAESLRNGTYFKNNPPKPSSVDSEAVAWAKANPNDPRSAQILNLQR